MNLPLPLPLCSSSPPFRPPPSLCFWGITTLRMKIMGQFYVVWLQMKCLRDNRVVNSLQSQIAPWPWDVKAHGTCLLWHLLMHLRTKWVFCLKPATALSTCSPLLQIPCFCPVTKCFKVNFYDSVVPCLLSNKSIKHQNWLASHQSF